MEHFPNRWVRRAAVAAVAGLIAAGGTACSGSAPPVTPDTLTLAQAGDITFLPTNCYNPSWTCQAVYDTLVKVDPDSNEEVLPWLVSEWEYSEGNTVLSLTIRDDVDFTDGTHLDAEGVKANLDWHIDPDNATAIQVYIGIDEIEVTGEYTLDITLSKPNAIAVAHLDYLGPIVSPASLDDVESLGDNPVGSGPYLYDAENSTQDVERRFTRNPDYWNAEAFPYDNLIVKILPDATARLNALVAGEVDVAEIDAAAAPSAESNDLALFPQVGSWAGLVLGDKGGVINPAFGDLRVRQAISMAFDRQAMVDSVLGGFGVASNQGYYPGWTQYHPELESEYPYDPERAKELLAEAGYPDGFDLTIPTPGAAFDRWNPVVQQFLGDIGIRVTYETMPDFGVWIAAYAALTFPVALVEMDAGGTILNLVSPTNNELNPFHWEREDPEVERLLDEMNAGSAEASADLGEKFVEEAWFAVWAHIETVFAAQQGIDITSRIDGRAPYLNQIRPAGG